MSQSNSPVRPTRRSESAAELVTAASRSPRLIYMAVGAVLLLAGLAAFSYTSSSARSPSVLPARAGGGRGGRPFSSPEDIGRRATLETPTKRGSGGPRVGPAPVHTKGRILVTGGAGFIGSHLARQLKERGDEVVVIDNFNSYYSVQLKEARAQNLTAAGIKVIKGDVCDAELLAAMFAKYKFTAVVHLAAQAGVRYSIEQPLAYVKANVQCFVVLLEVMKDYSHVPLVYASSSSVYGAEARIPFSLSDPVDHQTNLYGATKRSDELIARAYHHLYNISVTGLRFFTVYGEWGRPDMAPFIFTKKVSNGNPIDVFGHGQMRRDFTYVGDIVNGVIRSVDHAGADELFNIGNGKSVLLDDFISVVEKAVGKKAIKNMKPRNHAELPVTFADISHTTEILGYKSTTGVEKGVPAFVRWYKWYNSRSDADIAAAHKLMDTYVLDD